MPLKRGWESQFSLECHPIPPRHSIRCFHTRRLHFPKHLSSHNPKTLIFERSIRFRNGLTKMIFTKPIISLFLLVSHLTMIPFAQAQSGNDSDLVDHDFKLAVRLEADQDIELTPDQVSNLEQRKSMHCYVCRLLQTHAQPLNLINPLFHNMQHDDSPCCNIQQVS